MPKPRRRNTRLEKSTHAKKRTITIVRPYISPNGNIVSVGFDFGRQGRGGVRQVGINFDKFQRPSSLTIDISADRMEGFDINQFISDLFSPKLDALPTGRRGYAGKGGEKPEPGLVHEDPIGYLTGMGKLIGGVIARVGQSLGKQVVGVVKDWAQEFITDLIGSAVEVTPDAPEPENPPPPEPVDGGTPPGGTGGDPEDPEDPEDPDNPDDTPAPDDAGTAGGSTLPAGLVRILIGLSPEDFVDPVRDDRDSRPTTAVLVGRPEFFDPLINDREGNADRKRPYLVVKPVVIDPARDDSPIDDRPQDTRRHGPRPKLGPVK